MAVRDLQHFALSVPDLAAGVRFYEDFGLEVRAEGANAVLRCAGRDQDQVILTEGPARRLHHLAFGTDQEGLAEIRASVQGRTDVREVDPPDATPGPGLWLRDWEDMLFNVRLAASAPSRGGPDPATPAPAWSINTPGHYGRQGSRGVPARDASIRPRRLGHVLHFTTDFERRIAFYQAVLGLRLSDRAQDIVAFMHSVGGSDHHIIGLIQDARTGFHHASFEVANVDEVGLAACRMLDKGYRNGWGFGRHVIGSNFFHYIRDPWMGMAEYFCDIDYIPAGADWAPRNFPPEDALYLWGPDEPPDFGANFEGEPA